MNMNRLLIALALASGLAITATLAHGYTANGVAVVTAVAGPVTFERAAVTQPLKFRDDLQWRDVVEAGKEGIARLLMLGKMSLTVRELSRVELRQDAVQDGGTLYDVNVNAGKIRMSVERSLVGSNERIQVRTPNAVAGVRGTDFVVEIEDQPRETRVLGLLASRDPLIQLVQAPAGPETRVYTIAGAVDVLNPLAPLARAERLGPFDGARIRGQLDPIRFRFTPNDLVIILKGLHVPPPPPAGRAAASENAKAKAEAGAANEVGGGPVGGGVGAELKPLGAGVEQLIKKPQCANKPGPGSGMSCQ